MAEVRYLTVAEGKQVQIDQYPNFHKSGSLKGVRKNFGWKNALVVLCGSYYYAVPQYIYDMAK